MKTFKIFNLANVIFIFLIASNALASDKNFDKSLVLSSTSGELSKISALILKEAYVSLGIKIIVKVLPAERALQSSNRGIYDGEVHRIKGINKKYANLVIVNLPINYIYFSAFSTRKLKLVNLRSLHNYRIGIMRGIKIIEYKTKDMNRIFSSNNKTMFLNLKKGYIDVCIVPRLSGLKEIKDNNFKNIYLNEPPLFERELFHYLHKKNKSLVAKIYSVLREMKRKGRIKQIQKKYIKKLIGK